MSFASRLGLLVTILAEGFFTGFFAEHLPWLSFAALCIGILLVLAASIVPELLHETTKPQ